MRERYQSVSQRIFKDEEGKQPPIHMANHSNMVVLLPPTRCYRAQKTSRQPKPQKGPPHQN